MPVQTLPELFLTAVREKPRPDCFSHRDESGKYVDVSSTEIHRRVRALRFGLRSLGFCGQRQLKFPYFFSPQQYVKYARIT